MEKFADSDANSESVTTLDILVLFALFVNYTRVIQANDQLLTPENPNIRRPDKGGAGTRDTWAENRDGWQPYNYIK